MLASSFHRDIHFNGGNHFIKVSNCHFHIVVIIGTTLNMPFYMHPFWCNGYALIDNVQRLMKNALNPFDVHTALLSLRKCTHIHSIFQQVQDYKNTEKKNVTCSAHTVFGSSKNRDFIGTAPKGLCQGMNNLFLRSNYCNNSHDFLGTFKMCGAQCALELIMQHLDPKVFVKT